MIIDNNQRTDFETLKTIQKKTLKIKQLSTSNHSKTKTNKKHFFRIGANKFWI